MNPEPYPEPKPGGLICTRIFRNSRPHYIPGAFHTHEPNCRDSYRETPDVRKPAYGNLSQEGIRYGRCPALIDGAVPGLGPTRWRSEVKGFWGLGFRVVMYAF